MDHDRVEDDVADISWATALKRTFEAYLRGERPNMVRRFSAVTNLSKQLKQYGEYIDWTQ